MPDFAYVARSSSGSLAKGTLTAHDRAAAIRQIEALGSVPIRIEVAGPATPRAGQGEERAKADGGAGTGKAGVAAAAAPGAETTLPLGQLFLFTEQLAHLLSAGMTLDQALGILVNRLQQPKLQGIVKALHKGLIDGRSLSQVMRDFPAVFSSLYVNMVSAGEASGSLAEILRRLVTHIAGVKLLRDKVQQALVYPAVLVLAGVVLIIVFMTVMVPQLTGFFTSTGQKLPLPTQILLQANAFLTGYWWLLLLIGGGIVFGWKAVTRTPAGRLRWDRFIWHFPGFSRITRYRFYAQFARTLGTLMENGVPLLKSLELLEAISGNQWVRERMVRVRAAVTDGVSLSKALADEKLFPPLFLDMMAVGEQTGRFSETMEMIADVHGRELDKQVQFVTALVPPLVIIAIAVIVGLVVFGILSAVFNLTSGLHHPGAR
ncbi:MAG TPA: type II secretion system F family protein [Chthoniobacteraceae bacterium]|nr:type II secretion system F family protein [Chthoniobacteraceae bacterium]